VPQYNPRPTPGRSSRTFAQVTGINFPQATVDFVIPNLLRDLEQGLCITVALARKHASPYVRAMYREAYQYFTQLKNNLDRAAMGDQLAMTRAWTMADFPEPHEIRFGYTRVGSMGNGVGAGELSGYILQSLLRWPQLRAACAVEPDSLCLIERIGLDRVSDVMATITKKHLIEFTIDRAAFWGFDPACMRTVDIENVWDSAAGRLLTVTASVPVDDRGAAIILVPKGIVRSSPPLKVRQYFNDVYGSARADGEESKADLARDAENNPGALGKFVEDRLRDPEKFKARREFRDE
jgi:hypothetical protein